MVAFENTFFLRTEERVVLKERLERVFKALCLHAPEALNYEGSLGKVFGQSCSKSSSSTHHSSKSKMWTYRPLFGESPRAFSFSAAYLCESINDSSNPHTIIKGPTKSVNNELNSSHSIYYRAAGINTHLLSLGEEDKEESSSSCRLQSATGCTN